MSVLQDCPDMRYHLGEAEDIGMVAVPSSGTTSVAMRPSDKSLISFARISESRCHPPGIGSRSPLVRDCAPGNVAASPTRAMGSDRARDML